MKYSDGTRIDFSPLASFFRLPSRKLSPDFMMLFPRHILWVHDAGNVPWSWGREGATAGTQRRLFGRLLCSFVRSCLADFLRKRFRISHRKLPFGSSPSRLCLQTAPKAPRAEAARADLPPPVTRFQLDGHVGRLGVGPSFPGSREAVLLHCGGNKHSTCASSEKPSAAA